MEVVITSLDALIHKATNASLERPDPAAVEAFCAILSDSANGPHIATRVIATRMRSHNQTEALLALEVLDICMKRCDVIFRVEVDKFRFLNEMIKLVSPKYYGNRTAPAVKQKVLNLMYSWTVEYPRELKIKDAYEMLKKQGVVKDIPTPPVPKEEPQSTPKPKTKDGLFQDDEKGRLLQKLLQSKNPEDIQAANRLIKTMVKEDERRTETISRRVTELQTVHNNARLLDEMLDQYKPGASSVEDLDLIKELYAACVRLKPTVFKLAAETQHNEEMLSDVLEANDELTQVSNKFTTVISLSNARAEQKVEQSRTNNSSELSNVSTTNGNSLLDLNTIPAHTAPELEDQNKQSNIEVLGDIFSSNSTVELPPPTDILKPISLIPQITDVVETKTAQQQTVNKGLKGLDDLGEELLKASYGPSSSKFGLPFNGKSDKTPLNLITKTTNEQSAVDSNIKSPPLKDQTPTNSNELDLDFLINKTLAKESHCGTRISESHPSDDVGMLDITMESSSKKSKRKVSKDDEQEITLLEYLKDMKGASDSNKEIKSNNPIETPEPVKSDIVKSHIDNINTNVSTPESVNHKNEVKPLTDINIGLESITPGDKPPMIVFEESDGISVILHFTKNKPRPDVSVIVLSMTSKNKLAIQDFKFHAVVPKGCKARLLPPSGEKFPPFSPFLPPAAITQVMLIAHPLNISVFLKFVITYTCEEDSVTEMGEVSKLPLDEI